jgi:serine phosphatase RsbU (regulator of sigma subunit)/RNA polymerase-binding transcription factor DksA
MTIGTDGRLHTVQRTLRDQAERHADELARLTAYGTTAERDGMDPQTVAALVDSTRDALADTTQALKRIADGTYGRCERCDVDIPVERLEILPHARFCVPCQQASRGRPRGGRYPFRGTAPDPSSVTRADRYASGMAGLAGRSGATTSDPAPVAAAVDPVIRELLAAIPVGCSWLTPVRAADGQVTDFLVEAASSEARDVYGRGEERVGGLVSVLYPTLVGGPLWQLYLRVQETGEPGRLADFRYAESRPGVVTDSWYEISVRRVRGGLLCWWQRVDEARRRLDRAEQLGNLGWTEYDLTTGAVDWSAGMYRIFERDPVLGPMSRNEQDAALVPEDRGVAETGWQTLDSGAASDVTVRIRVGRSVKVVRVLSDVARDADGQPLKIYAVVQDVTAREDSKSALERLRDQLRTRETTALAEHRLAAQLQNLIQPVPAEPFALAGLEAAVVYLPAGSTTRVGGDWYHAENLPDGRVALAVGDVAGHGLDAANGMAHLRFSLVAWLSIGIDDPGVLLQHMCRLSARLAITGTAIVAVFDPARRTLCWARAGHLPPLLARGGTVTELGRPDGLLLGVDPDSRFAPETSQLRVDDLVLFYTDGLVEHRPGSAVRPFEAITRTLAAMSTTGEMSRLRDLSAYASPDDDACTLAVRVC